MPPRTKPLAHRPMLQGKYDRLCGIYSFVNAIQLADRDNHHLSQRLFDCGLEFLISNKKLRAVMLQGMTRKLWLKLGRHIINEKNRISKNQFEFLHLSTLDLEGGYLTWQEIADCTNKGWPVLAHFEGAYNHFTVVSQVTAGRIILFDSNGQKWVQRRSCHIGKSNVSQRFWIKQSGLVALRTTSVELKIAEPA